MAPKMPAVGDKPDFATHLTPRPIKPVPATPGVGSPAPTGAAVLPTSPIDFNPGRGFAYPGAPGARMATGMQQLVSRGMDMLREHAPEIADAASQAFSRLGAARDFRQGVRSEVREGLTAGRSAADIKAGLADNISTFAGAVKPRDPARFTERVTGRVGRRVDRAYARRGPSGG